MLYAFGDCVLDTERRELRRGPQRVDVEPQVFDLLEFLIRNRGRVASRDDLLAAVWQGRIVSESTLSSRINAARSAIGDDGAGQRWIRTLPRKGLRFVGEVRERTPETDDTPQSAHTSASGPAAVDGPAIAVLPFTNMSGDADTDYFADGMAEEIITALSQCGGILVIARNSSFIYKGRAVDVRQVGQELGVGYLLEGSVRRRGDQLRITAQLIETASGTHLWAGRFEGSTYEVFELQDRIAESAAAIIEPKLRFAEVERVRRKPPQKLAAYDLWLQSLSCAGEYTPEGLAAAVTCIERALEIDPAYAVAMATGAFYHAQSYLHGGLQQLSVPKAAALGMARRALEIAKDDSNVQWMSAFAIWILALDAPRARELFRRSLISNPSSAIALTMAGWVEAINDNPLEGRRLIERSMRLNPRHPHGWMMSFGMATTFIAEGGFREAARWAETALADNPHSTLVLRALIVACVNSGRQDSARALAQQLLAIDPQFTISGWRANATITSPPLVKRYSEAFAAAGLPQ